MHEGCLLPAREDIEFVSKCAKGKKYISFYNEGLNSIKPIKLYVVEPLTRIRYFYYKGANELRGRKVDFLTGVLI